MRPDSDAARALLLGTLLVVAAMGPLAAPVAADDHDDDDDGPEPADVVHVSEDGEIVLEYRESSAGDLRSARFGADVATGIAYGLFTSERENQNGTGELSAVLRPDGLQASGELAVDSQTEVRELDGSVEFVQSDAESSMDAAISGVLAPAREGASSASTEGTVTIGVDEFRASASTSQQQPPGSTFRPNLTNSIESTVTETDSGYEVSVAETRPVSRFSEEDWNTEEAARATLAAQFDGITEQFGGTYELTIGGYEYSPLEEGANGTSRYVAQLDIAYEATLTGVETGIAETFVSELNASEGLSLSPAEQETLADALSNVTVEEASFSSFQNGTHTRAAGSVHVTGYEDAFLRYVEHLSEVESDAITDEDGEAVRSVFLLPLEYLSNADQITEEEVEEIRTVLDARERANLEQTLTWSGQLTGTAEETTVEGSASLESTNWADYVDELEAEGIDIAGEVSGSLSAELADGDSVVVRGEVNVSREDLVSEGISAIRPALGESDEDTGGAMAVLDAFERSEFRIAKVSAMVGSEEVTIEAGAKFDNMSELAAVEDPFLGGVPVRHLYAEGDTTETRTYVSVGGDHTVEDLRERGLVTDDTEINRDADVSGLPTLDGAEAAAFLGVEDVAPPDDSDDGPPDDSGDGGETPTATPDDPADGTDAPGETATDPSEPPATNASEDPTDGDSTPDGPDATSTPGQPGFGALLALAALTLVTTLAAGARRRR